jgi:hypothetical protein
MWDLLCLPVWLFSAIGLALLGIYGHYSSRAYVAYAEVQGTTDCEPSITKVGASAAADQEAGKRALLGDSSTRRPKTTFRMGDYLLHVLPLAFSHYLSMPKN